MTWKPVNTAPHDGTRIRLKNDEGGTHRGHFVEPHWWTIAPGVRIADGDLYKGDMDIMRVIEWDFIP